MFEKSDFPKKYMMDMNFFPDKFVMFENKMHFKNMFLFLRNLQLLFQFCNLRFC